MDLSNEQGDKITPERQARRMIEILTWTIIVMQIIIAIGVFPFLPATVPIHWDATGQVNGYGSKWIDTLLFPALSLGFSLFLRVLMVAGPRLGSRENARTNTRLLNVFLAGFVLFLLIIQLVVSAIALGIQTNLILVVNLAVAVLYIFLGNYMGKLRRNFWMGIRTPWTVTSDVVWERTHRLGGWLFVACGLLAIPISFVPAVRLWGIVVPVILVAIFLYIYSYLCYRQHAQGEDQPVSHPFDHPDEG